MKTITSFSLNANEFNAQRMYLPDGAEVLSAELVENRGLLLYAISEKPTLNHNLRTFKVYSTYDTIYDENIKYVGTVFVDGNAKHVFELV